MSKMSFMQYFALFLIISENMHRAIAAWTCVNYFAESYLKAPWFPLNALLRIFKVQGDLINVLLSIVVNL
ncbi:hypothetical protein AAZX31_16G018300 [Glycine max]